MKIIYIAPTLDNYGASRTLQELIDNSFDFFQKIIVVVPFDAKIEHLTKKTSKENFQIIFRDIPIVRRSDIYRLGALVGIPKLLIKTLMIKKELKKLIKQENPEIIHIFTSAPILSLFGQRGLKRKTIVSIHENPKNVFEKFMVKKLAEKYSSNQICCSGFVQTAFGLPKSSVIHSGADVSRFKNYERLLSPARGNINIVCVGRFNSWKGQDILIGSLPLLIEQGVNFNLDFIGGGFDGNQVFIDEAKRHVALLNLQDRVNFIGETNELESVLKNYQISVIPSKHPEPFGKIVVESMAAGLIVLVANHGGPAEIVNDGINGFTFDPNNSTSLASKILYISKLSLDQSNSISARAVERADLFSSGETSTKYLNVYHQIITGPSS